MRRSGTRDGWPPRRGQRASDEESGVVERLAQLGWLLVVCVVAWVGMYIGLGSATLALWIAVGVFVVVGTVILIRPFRRDDWDDFWEMVFWWWCW